MARAVSSLLLLLVACGNAPVEGLAGGPRTVELFSASITAAMISFCHCHHGQGPGADGTVKVRFVNTSDHDVEVEPQEIAIDSTADSFSTGVGGGYLSHGDKLIVVAGGSMAIDLVPYIDIDRNEIEMLQGEYIVHLRYRAGGQEHDVASVPIIVNAL